MESDDDYASFSPAPVQEPLSPIHHKKLKRLKKGVRVSNQPNTQPSDLTPSFEDSQSRSDADQDSSETLEEPVDSIRPGLESEGFEGGRDQVGSRDGFEVDEEESHLSGSVDEEFGGEDDVQAKKSAKKRLCLEGDEEEEKKKKKRRKSVGVSENSVDLEDADWDVEERSHLGDLDAPIDEKEDDSISRLGDETGDEKWTKKKGHKSGREENKKKKRSKNVDGDGKSEPSARTKKRLEKERKIHLEKLHAETQRLLRETSDAAFEPVRPVYKPISSVLEKIRLRKLELLKEAGIISNKVETSHSPRQVSIGLHTEQVHNDGFEREEDAVENGEVVIENERSIDLDANTVDSCGKPSSILSRHENFVSDMALDESKGAFRTPINDTQDLFCGSQESDDDDLQPSSPTDSPSEEALAPSLLAMNLKLDSAPLDDISSDEEDDDKENLEPQSHKVFDGDSYPKGDPVKAFVDDEAEEEDDSDNDLMRFPENEEDEEQDDNEELKDLIVTGYKEKPIDNEMRDQLHQKWLEQQDAAATDNVLQRLKCGWKQKEPALLEEEEDGEFDANSGDESADDLPPINVVRINSTKVKEMIPQMFTEKDDGFLSSDDEETEQRLVKQRLLEKVEQSTSFLSPADDEGSREIFGMIKKVNVAPDTKKKAKSSSFFDMLITGGNSNSSSKSSFLGWPSNNSLKPSQKNGSSTFRSYIFGRDDSNSRDGITTLEASSDMVENVNRPTKTATAKFNYSQTKISSQDTKTTNTSSSHSLLQILKRSSRQSDRTATVDQTQTAVLFAAFKSKTKSIKVVAKT